MSITTPEEVILNLVSDIVAPILAVGVGGVLIHLITKRLGFKRPHILSALAIQPLGIVAIMALNILLIPLVRDTYGVDIHPALVIIVASLLTVPLLCWFFYRESLKKTFMLAGAALLLMAAEFLLLALVFELVRQQLTPEFIHYHTY